MKVTNIIIDQLIATLVKIKRGNFGLIDIEVLQDEIGNKIILHPVKLVDNKDEVTAKSEDTGADPDNILISDPKINTENDDIFGMFNGLV